MQRYPQTMGSGFLGPAGAIHCTLTAIGDADGRPRTRAGRRAYLNANSDTSQFTGVSEFIQTHPNFSTYPEQTWLRFFFPWPRDGDGGRRLRS